MVIIAKKGCRPGHKALALSAMLLLATVSSAIPTHEPQMTALSVVVSRTDDAGTLLDLESPQPTQPPSFYELFSPHDLRKRHEERSSDDEEDKSDETTTEHHKVEQSKTIPTSIFKSLSSIDLKTTATSNAIAVTNVPLPSAFDGTAGNDFGGSGTSDNCPTFMQNLLNSPDFQACYPLSMMLQTSTSFFNAEKQLFSIVRVLDATCAADSNHCATYLDAAATNLTTLANCKTEYDSGQNLIMQAYRGMRAYKTLYAASCLQDPDNDMYCFASAVTNSSYISDTYLYFMPYGSNLPGGSTPGCDWCTRQTMAVYHAASADRNSLIANVYEGAATQINTLCGVSFVNATLPEAETSQGITVKSPAAVTAIGSLLFIAAWNCWI